MRDFERTRSSVTAVERGVAAGRDISGNVFTGDVFFGGGYEPLEDALQYTDGLVAGLNLDRFTGRAWLVDKIDKFFRTEKQGYFVLEADAGLGKTTFCAWLARSRSYPHHFVKVPGDLSGGNSATALKNLAAQLINTYRLDDLVPGRVLRPALASPGGFARLLAQAAARRAQLPDGRLVLVVDGLDEAETPPPGSNPLGLPAVLPTGVYCLVSHRPGVIWADPPVPRRLFQLRAADIRNLADMEEFLRRAAARPGVAEALRAAGYSRDQFVSTLADKCQGVWIYLRYVVDEIDRGDRSPLDLDNLPRGVWQYYAQFWARWQDPHANAWNDEQLPLLATLGAVQEPATLPLLCALADLPPHPRLRDLLAERWRPFLTVTDDEEPRYSIYHTSLREFLAGQLAPAEREQLTDTEQHRLGELARATRQAHRRIADRYLTHWGGLEHNLPGLADPHRRSQDAGYGLRQLASHLSAAGRSDDLHRLLACQWTLPAAGPTAAARPVNAWFTAHDQTGDLAWPAICATSN